MEMPVNVIIRFVLAGRVNVLANKFHKRWRDILNFFNADEIQARIGEPVALNQYTTLLALFLQESVAQAAVD